MLNQNDLLDALLKEIDIVKHLATKVPEGGMDYRPSEGQRSTLEVLRYLSHCGLGGTYAMLDGNWDRYREGADAAKDRTAAEIAPALDAQAEALRALYSDISDDDFANKQATSPIGDTMPLGRALLELPVKWMTAYRMQLFLHAKAAGNNDIWTPNCWGGIDMDRPAASA